MAKMDNIGKEGYILKQKAAIRRANESTQRVGPTEKEKEAIKEASGPNYDRPGANNSLYNLRKLGDTRRKLAGSKLTYPAGGMGVREPARPKKHAGKGLAEMAAVKLRLNKAAYKQDTAGYNASSPQRKKMGISEAYSSAESRDITAQGKARNMKRYGRISGASNKYVTRNVRKAGGMGV